MCGVAGWLGEATVHDETVDAVLASLRHRGPDGTGSRRFGRAGLVHTRLRIIDLSPTGDQPMANEDGTVWTVFNGEIYNHHELRRDLERRGHRFRGTSDTEVLPHLYEEHGVELFKLLKGMFAVAILDTKTDTLVLARDRFGIKPLYVACGLDFAAFSSEIPALKRFPGIDTTPNGQAIADYAALHYVPAPQTIFTGIEALEPGCAIQARIVGSELEVVRHRFHRWAPEIDPDLTLDKALETADTLIAASVARQLESDVPLGAMLSGGIDSSLVTAAAQRGTPGGLLTFNVRPSDLTRDETAYASAVADYLHTRHKTVEVVQRSADWDSISSTLAGLGQPLADPALFAVGSVSHAMRQHVTVALSGDGGDEFFGGYRIYWKVGVLARLLRIPSPALAAAGQALRPVAAAGAIGSTVPRQVSALAGADDTSLVQALSAALTDKEHRALLVDPDAVEPLRRLFERQWQPTGLEGSRLERLSSHTVEVQVRLLLASKFLFKSDMASMRESLELRVPLLDEDLAEFGLSLPHRLRVNGHSGKPVLREVARRYVPEDIASRPKHGFAAPIDSWVDDGFRAAAREALLDARAPIANHFQRSVYEPWVTAFANRDALPSVSRETLDTRILMLTALDACLRA
jgi:asparagine synthase (glutamine-hydrolysing)